MRVPLVGGGGKLQCVHKPSNPFSFVHKPSNPSSLLPCAARRHICTVLGPSLSSLPPLRDGSAATTFRRVHVTKPKSGAGVQTLAPQTGRDETVCCAKKNKEKDGGVSAVTIQDDDETSQQPERSPKGPSWLERVRGRVGLREFSMFATALCAVDCTVLPVILSAIPLLDIAPIDHHVLHAYTSKLVTYFVGPVALSAVGTSYFQHRNKLVASIGFVGAVGVMIPHSPYASAAAAVLGPSFPMSLMSPMGCVTLLGSQWYSRRLAPPCCSKPIQNQPQ